MSSRATGLGPVASRPSGGKFALAGRYATGPSPVASYLAGLFWFIKEMRICRSMDALDALQPPGSSRAMHLRPISAQCLAGEILDSLQSSPARHFFDPGGEGTRNCRMSEF